MPAVRRDPSFGRTDRIRGPVGSTACRNGYHPRGPETVRSRACGSGGNLRVRQIENDIPQPQVVAALGLLITNRDPCKSSL